MTTITIDGVFIAAFFAGLVTFVGALVGAYIKIRSWQAENREANETMKSAQEANVKAVEKVHTIVNSRDTEQRKLIKSLTEEVKSLAVQRAGGNGRPKPSPRKRKR